MIKRHRNEKLIRGCGDAIAELREARGLSQEKVLFETNIHLSNIENGRQDITIATLVELCSTYDTSLEDFLRE